MAITIEERIGQHYGGLSDKLRVAADYVAANPVEVATRSLRAVATTSGVSPATFSRLARALGYDDYEAMRDDGRAAVGRRMVPFSQRAHDLRTSGAGQSGREVLARHAAAALHNVSFLERDIAPGKLEAAVDVLHKARRVLLVGSLGSSGLVDYLGYQMHWFAADWIVAGRNGTALAAALSRLGPEDAVLALSKTPHAKRSVSALEAAQKRGIPTVFITDTYSSPALPLASHAFVVPTEGPQFFSSYAATVVLLETIVSLLLARAGEDAEDRIRAAEDQLHSLGETWAP
ncbi:MAG: MurR/RpiR family transcriptional regulator [Rhodobacteraceae bacterium]|nr:MurR/RpiR family transcriptional regulator [Paracoccaceae bacterium]